MAKNEVYRDADRLAVAATDPTTPASGDPVVYGQRPGVCEVTESSDGLSSVKVSGVFTLSVKGVDGSGNSAVAEGDILYYVSADTPKISKKATGVRFGYAMGAVTSGATATIPVIIGY
jgi:predicted RecA/RadA family phage recombinase